jgi:hypothetical protein
VLHTGRRSSKWHKFYDLVRLAKIAIRTQIRSTFTLSDRRPEPPLLLRGFNFSRFEARGIHRALIPDHRVHLSCAVTHRRLKNTVLCGASDFAGHEFGVKVCLETELNMLKKSNVTEVVPGAVEGARSATGSAPGAAAEVKRWSANRKKGVVLRLLRGEPVDAISREVSVPIYRLEEWRERALAGIDAGLKERENDPLEAKLGEATRRIGELVMENELLRKERQARHPLVNRRSSK